MTTPISSSTRLRALEPEWAFVAKETLSSSFAEMRELQSGFRQEVAFSPRFRSSPCRLTCVVVPWD